MWNKTPGTKSPATWSCREKQASAFLGPGLKILMIKLHTQVWHSDYYLLLIFHVGNGEVATRSLRAIRRDFSDLGQQVKGSGAEVVFTILPVAGNDEGRNEEPANLYLAVSLVSLAEFWGFWSQVGQHDTEHAGSRWDAPVSKGKSIFA